MRIVHEILGEMINKLYYVIEKEVHFDEVQEVTTGNMEIRLYKIENNILKFIAELATVVESPYSIEEEIQFWLDNNGFGTQEFEFEQL